MNWEDMLSIYRGKRVLITGHTGFKGAWLALWLHRLEAGIMGIALEPTGHSSLYSVVGIGEIVQSDLRININDYNSLSRAIFEFQPEVVIHLAAQALVRPSYEKPIETLETNIIGTAKVLEICRQTPSIRAVVIVTSDKCYRNNEWVWGYREIDPMGGYDPYSASKGCAELVCDAYAHSFFSISEYGTKHHTAVATARAGNAIGGGDWAKDRLIPDFVRAITTDSLVHIRYPESIRPWQHVLECLSGYLLLGASLLKDGVKFNGAWNFSPINTGDVWSVRRVSERICKLWPRARFTFEETACPHEAHLLRLDCTKANIQLGWRPRWNVSRAIDETVSWYKEWMIDPSVKHMHKITLAQIEDYMHSPTLEL